MKEISIICILQIRRLKIKSQVTTQGPNKSSSRVSIGITGGGRRKEGKERGREGGVSELIMLEGREL